MICPFCGYERKYEYHNVYGTICPHCKKTIPPDKKPEFVQHNEKKLNLLRATVRGILRDNLQKSLRSNNMTISTDNANITIEFTWQSDEDPSYQLHVKHHVSDGTPTISVSEDGNEWYNFPSIFFQEVTEFLESQKLSRNSNSKKSFRSTVDSNKKEDNVSASSRSGSAANSNSKSKLPLPNVSSTNVETPTESTEEYSQQVEPLVTADTEPLESFAGINRLVEKTSTHNPKKSQRSERKNKLNEDVPDRPVIRSADESMSSELRGHANAEKSIRPVKDQ